MFQQSTNILKNHFEKSTKNQKVLICLSITIMYFQISKFMYIRNIYVYTALSLGLRGPDKTLTI